MGRDVYDYIVSRVFFLKTSSYFSLFQMIDNLINPHQFSPYINISTLQSSRSVRTVLGLCFLEKQYFHYIAEYLWLLDLEQEMVKYVNFSGHLKQFVSMEESADPPFEETYKDLLNNLSLTSPKNVHKHHHIDVEERELPLIDLSKLSLGEYEREECKREIAKASQEWGFFQVVNHGVSREILEKMRSEQVKVFKKPFNEKANDENLLGGSYRWGTPSATCLRQLSWSEAFHVPLNHIFDSGGFTSLSSTMQQYATAVSELAQLLASILAENLGHKSGFIRENCLASTCYLRMNRYPPCPIPVEVTGLMPHTDSDFLTILHQDEIGGLQLVKDGKWIAVKPNQEALIINIGDLFQAWSNDVYRSVNHRVVTNKRKDRFSTAYFLCPSYDTVIGSCVEPSIYKSFSFRQYRQQVQDDVKDFGHKIGLSRFLCKM